MNDKEKIGLKKLQDAFKEINSEELDNLNIPKEDFEFSEKYKKNMEKLLAKQRKPYWQYVNTAGKRAVACILVFIMIFASSMSISAFREPVVEFFVNVYERFVEIFCKEDGTTTSPDEIETIYTLGYLPEGYEFESRKVDNNSVKTVFVNGCNKIKLSQYVLRVGLLLDNENTNFEIQTENGIKIAVVEKFEDKALYWNSSEYSFKLVVPKEFSDEECIKIIESIEKLT
ncbi:MAG: DUF4367 domain-containing protein [Clostridia bacterium]|nr:DUF4367 domain-containing protein [Clostridia bacterium]